MKKIEEVKEHFKNAKVVECLEDGKHFKVDLNSLNIYLGYYYLDSIDREHGCVNLEVWSKEELHKFYPKTEFEDIDFNVPMTVEQWELPLSMLDEVKEVGTAVVDVKIDLKFGKDVLYVEYEATLTNKPEFNELKLLAHLEKATKEFFKG